MAGLFDDLIPAKPAAESGGLFDDLIPPPKRQVGAGESLSRGVSGVLPSLGQQAAFLLGLPGAAGIDALSSVFSGKLDTSTVDAVGDYIGDRQQTMNTLAIDPRTETQGLGGKVAQGAPNVLVDLAAAFATGGDSLLAKGAARVGTEEGLSAAVRQAARASAETGAKASLVPATRAGIDRAETVVDRGGTATEAAAAGGTAAEAATVANMVPVAAQGGLLSRVLQGAVALAPLEYAERGIVESATPARLGIDKPMTAEDAILSTIFGAGLAGGLGHRGEEAPMDLRGDTQAVKERAAASLATPGADPAAALADFIDLMQRGERPQGFQPDVPAPAVAPGPARGPAFRPGPQAAPALGPVARPIASVAAEPPLLDRAPPPAATVESPARPTSPEPAGEAVAPIDLSPARHSRRVVIGKSAITYSVDDGVAKVILLSTPPKARGTGQARAAMDAFTAAADAKGMPIELVVAPLSKDGDPARLEAGYARMGFQPIGKTGDGSTIMRREPTRAPEPAAPPAPAPETPSGLRRRAWVPQTERGQPVTTTGKDGVPRPVLRPSVDYAHDSLIHWLASNGGVNYESLNKASRAPSGVMKTAENRPFGSVSWPAVRRNGGLTVDEVFERMQQDGWMPQDDPNNPSAFDHQAALEMIDNALNGREVLHPTEGREERAARAYDERAADEAPMQAEHDDSAYHAAMADYEAEMASRLDRFDDIPAEDYPAAIREAELADQERQDGVDTGAEAADSGSGEAGGVRQRAPEAPAPARGQAGLFPPATAREAVDAAARARDDERNGRTGTGRTDMLAGKGELFAGPRPDQARVDEPQAQPPADTIEIPVGRSGRVTQPAPRFWYHNLRGRERASDGSIEPYDHRENKEHAGSFPAGDAEQLVYLSPQPFGDSVRIDASKLDLSKMRLTGQAEGYAVYAGKIPPGAIHAEPGAAPPPKGETTSLKNEVMQAEREFRGEEPLPTTERQSNDDTLERAKADLDANPSRGAEIVEAINNDVHGTATNHDQAVLLVHKQNVMKARDRAADRASDPDLTEDQRAVARREFDQLEGDLHRIDEATKAIGTESGRILQLRTRLLRDDFTFEALERKARAIKGEPLTVEESATIKQQAERIAKLEEDNAAAQRAIEEATLQRDADTTYRNLVEEMARALKPDGSAKKRPILETLKKRADDSRTALAALDDVKSNRKQSGAVISPVAFLHLANIGAYHIANGAAKLADFVARMKADLADRFDRFSDVMPDVYEAAKAQIAATTKAGKKVATPAEVTAGIDAANLTHRDVYELARAHVLAGTHGEKAVMAATHADLVKLFPKITERDVRRLFADYGKAKFPSKSADKVELRELRALVQMQESIDRLTEGLAALKSGQQRDKMTQLVRDKRKQLNAMLREQERKSGPSPERLASYQDARITNLKNQIEDLERELRTGEKPPKPGKAPEPNAEAKRLQAIRDDLKKQLAAIEARRNPPKSPEEQYQERRAKTIAKQLADVRARIARNDYSKAVRPPPKELNAANKRAAFELAKAKQDIAVKQFEMMMKARPGWRRAIGTAAETLNLSRAVMTSFDLSAVLRQGGFIVLGHPVRAARSIGPMLKALASEKAAFEVDDEIANRPNFSLYKKAGLYLSEQNNHLPSKMEEAYLSRWLQKSEMSGGKAKRAALTAKNVATAPIRASGRAFTTFLNKLRADSFDAMAAAVSSNGQLTIEEARALGNYINVATGRGKIGTKQQAAVGLNTIFFAPKLVASRFNLLGGQPLYGGSMRTRNLIAQDYARFLTGVATTIGLAALAHDPEDGPLTSLDPRSSDFLKIRFGNTFIDPMAGLAQVTTFLTREATGEKVTTTGKLVPIRDSYRLTDYVDWAGELSKAKVAYGGDDGLTIAGRFARTKFAPLPGGIANLIAGEDVTGQPVDAGDVVQGLVTPLSFNNIFDVMREHGVTGGAAILTLEMLGMGVQYRKPRETKDDDEKPRPQKSKYE